MYDTHFPTPPWPWLVAGAAPRREPLYARSPLAPATVAARESIYRILRERPWATALVLSGELRMPAPAVQRHLRSMVRDRAVERIGGGRYAVVAAQAADAGGGR